VKLYFSPWGVEDIIPIPAVIGDAVEAFELVHRKDVCNSLGHVPHLEPLVVPLEIACHQSRVTIDLDSLSDLLHSLQILVVLESRHHGAPV
jgi:hypothetical protein